jgi:hypothetical protein
MEECPKGLRCLYEESELPLERTEDAFGVAPSCPLARIATCAKWSA